MDEGVPGHSPKVNSFIVYLGVAVFLVIVVGTYLYVRSSAPAGNPLKSYASVIYLVPQKDATVLWYDSENGQLVQHPPLALGAVTGVARALGATYFSVAPLSLNATSTVYRYEGGSYTKIYESPHVIQGLSVSLDGAFIGINGVGTDGKNAAVVDVATASSTLLGDSVLPPQFLSAGGVHTALYVSNTSLVARVFAQGQWQKPVKVFTSTGATFTTFATDGLQRFSFVEPDHRGIQEWQVVSTDPFSAKLKTNFEPMPGLSVAYGAGTLFGYKFTSQKNESRFHSISVTNLASATTASFTPPQSLGASASVILLPLPPSP